jgi:hypothetical protein
MGWTIESNCISLRKMEVAEQNCDIHDKELLAVVKAFKHW